MNPIPPTIYEPLRIIPEKKEKTEESSEEEIVPSIPYGWEDTKDFSWR